jgi:hypothetical protein
MSAVRATVRSGRLVSDEPVDLPEGTEVELFMVDAENAPDELDDAERELIDEAIESATRSVARGEAVDEEEVLRRVRAVA